MQNKLSEKTGRVNLETPGKAAHYSHRADLHPHHPPLPIFLKDFLTILSTAFPLIGIDTVPEPALALLAARVTAANLPVQSIFTRLGIDRRIRAALVLDRPIDAVGAGFHLGPLALALRRTGRNAQSAAQLVGERSCSRESGAGRARGDAVSLAVARSFPGPLRAVGPDLAGLEHAAGGHVAGCRDVERDFGVVGFFGRAVQVGELEVAGQQGALVTAVAALQRRRGGERCWDGCCVRESGAQREGVDDCVGVHCWIVRGRDAFLE